MENAPYKNITSLPEFVEKVLSHLRVTYYTMILTIILFDRVKDEIRKLQSLNDPAMCNGRMFVAVVMETYHILFDETY
ncbi:4836_t:CDS:1, partial [Diversispora eburnea]